MKIVVTGGAGYVGSVLTRLLLDAGHQVVVIDRMDYGVQSLFHLADHPKLSVLREDITMVCPLRECVEDADVVMHLAAIVGYPACAANPEESHQTNVMGTEVLLGCMKPDQFIIFASTGSVYGKVEGKACEATTPAPLSLYGQQKLKAEEAIKASGVPYTILRFATLYGISPRMRLDLLINDFAYKAVHQRQIVLFEGYFHRSFLHVEDAARAYLTVLRMKHVAANETYNVGCEQMTFTKHEIAKMIGKWVDYYLHEADIGHDVDQRNYEVDYRKFCALGYKRSRSTEESIKRLITFVCMMEERSPLRNA